MSARLEAVWERRQQQRLPAALILVLEHFVSGFKGFVVKLYCFLFPWRGALPPPTRVPITQFGQLCGVA